MKIKNTIYLQKTLPIDIIHVIEAKIIYKEIIYNRWDIIFNKIYCYKIYNKYKILDILYEYHEIARTIKEIAYLYFEKKEINIGNKFMKCSINIHKLVTILINLAMTI